MVGKAAYLRERIKTSLWPIPVALCLGSVVLAFSMLWLDRRLGLFGLRESLFAPHPAAARQVLGVVAGSIISVGGVAFSVTMVALTLTSGQYGPKVLRSFLGDNSSKVTLGLFLGTYLYTLVVLGGFSEIEQPRLTVMFSLILAFAALLGFVQLIHRTATDLQADQIVERIAQRMCRALSQLADEAGLPDRDYDTLGWRDAARPHAGRDIASVHRGYVQSVDHQGLVDWCVENDCVLQVRVRAGDFLVPGVRAFRLHAADAGLPGDIKTVQALNAHCVIGPMRTAVQDAEYTITQLNQLAARALSPGVNDPGTAITCIDWFSLALAEIIDRDLPGCVYLDAQGNARLLARTSDFAGLLKAVYAPLRQMSGSDVAVTVKLLESLCHLAQLTRRRERLNALALHGTLIVEGAVRPSLPAFDRQDIQRRYQGLQILTRSPALTG